MCKTCNVVPNLWIVDLSIWANKHSTQIHSKLIKCISTIRDFQICIEGSTLQSINVGPSHFQGHPFKQPCTNMQLTAWSKVQYSPWLIPTFLAKRAWSRFTFSTSDFICSIRFSLFDFDSHFSTSILTFRFRFSLFDFDSHFSTSILTFRLRFSPFRLRFSPFRLRSHLFDLKKICCSPLSPLKTSPTGVFLWP